MFGHRSNWFALLVSGFLLAGCADEPIGTSSDSSTSVAPSPSTSVPSSASADPNDPTKVVPASANIFGAGRDSAPAPGGGGVGTLPVLWALPAGADRVVTFPQISGEVIPVITEPKSNPAEGTESGSTDISSFGGISGIVDRDKAMFLVGVFLTDAEPTPPAPPRLDATGSPRNQVSAPLIGQTFQVGDGVGRSYRVPAAATRMFLGFADAALFRGAPGYYGNNRGELSVTVASAPR